MQGDIVLNVLIHGEKLAIQPSPGQVTLGAVAGLCGREEFQYFRAVDAIGVNVFYGQVVHLDTGPIGRIQGTLILGKVAVSFLLHGFVQKQTNPYG